MSKKIIISGGGTGGHIFPAVAIANALKAIDPAVDILFVGAKGRMEMEKVPAAGYKIIGLPIAGFQRRLTFENLLFFFRLFLSLQKARKIIKDFNPDAAVGVGGYASGPVLKIASKMGIPTVLQEQNSYAGVTNRLLAQKANKICVAYEGMEKYFPAEKIIITGNPVRQDLENIHSKREEAIKYFGINPEKKIVLVIGGSLGARTINQSIIANLKVIAESNTEFIWQCGKMYYQAAKAALADSGATNIRLFDFISRMDLAYASADAIISRAGAGSISELCLVGKPTILVPSPNVAEDHQTKNALALVNRNAAILIKDNEAIPALVNEVLKLIDEPAKCSALSVNIANMALKDSAKKIALEILHIITKGGKE